MKLSNLKIKLILVGLFAGVASVLWAHLYFQTPQNHASAANKVPLAQSSVKLAEPLIPAAQHPLWLDLSKTQQDALAPLAGVWSQMNAERKQKWLHIARRFSSMKPYQQERAQKRMRDWASLTSEQRELELTTCVLNISTKRKNWLTGRRIPNYLKDVSRSWLPQATQVPG